MNFALIRAALFACLAAFFLPGIIRSLKSGKVKVLVLPKDEIITRKKNPSFYWIIISFRIGIVLVIFGIALMMFITSQP